MARRPRVKLQAALLRAVLVAALGFASWPLLQRPFAALFRAAGNVVFEPISFGGDTAAGARGYARLVARREALAGLEDGPSYDSTLELHLSGVDQSHALFVSPRRLAYLPALLLAVLTAAAPLSWRARLRCVVFGWSGVLAIAIASLYAIALWVFAQIEGLVYELSSWQHAAVELGYRGFASPIANRFIAATLIAAALVASALRREQARDRVGDGVTASKSLR
jgi:hypothetical protein